VVVACASRYSGPRRLARPADAQRHRPDHGSIRRDRESIRTTGGSSAGTAITHRRTRWHSRRPKVRRSGPDEHSSRPPPDLPGRGRLACVRIGIGRATSASPVPATGSPSRQAGSPFHRTPSPSAGPEAHRARHPRRRHCHCPHSLSSTGVMMQRGVLRTRWRWPWRGCSRHRSTGPPGSRARAPRRRTQRARQCRARRASPGYEP
jgi:hypothetical protein